MNDERLDEESKLKKGSARGMPSGRTIAIAMLASMAVVGVVLGLLMLFDAHRYVLDLLRWLDDQGSKALLLFILIMALVMMLIIPGILFTTGAGFVFGVVEGSIAVVVGSTLGAVAAFLIARYAFGMRARVWLHNHARLDAFGEEVCAQGWKIVALTRMMPLFPFKITNYLFGLTPVRLRDFTWGTFFGVIPWSVHNVYLGAIAADLSGLTLGEARDPWGWALYIAGFVITIGTIFYLTRMARRVLARTEVREP
ncbi:MAG: TVP38/TMEM64 family protein [Chromatiales bacterium]|jgi:uncharacterized membrane protein YdjX (TVP38/TMEM64 family)|nr:TVP38/TMEM64 family protein [Chromatiales bacterium]